MSNKTSRTTRNLFRELIYKFINENNWKGIFQQMLILSDSLEDDGLIELATAYRYAAKHKKWPCTRLAWGVKGMSGGQLSNLRTKTQWTVFDWDTVTRKTWPLHSRLAKCLYKAILSSTPDRKYGGIHRAFVLLARALTICGNKIGSRKKADNVTR